MIIAQYAGEGISSFEYEEMVEKLSEQIGQITTDDNSALVAAACGVGWQRRGAYVFLPEYAEGEDVIDAIMPDEGTLTLYSSETKGAILVRAECHDYTTTWSIESFPAPMQGEPVVAVHYKHGSTSFVPVGTVECDLERIDKDMWYANVNLNDDFTNNGFYGNEPGQALCELSLSPVNGDTRIWICDGAHYTK